MRVLIDTNIVLDLLLERSPFVYMATALFEQIEQGRLVGDVTATTITNLFYILRKAEGRDVALAAIRQLLMGLHLCTVDRQTIETAIDLDLTDFEDGVQLACAIFNQLDGIVTRDRNDFSPSTIPIYTPIELLNQL